MLIGELHRVLERPTSRRWITTDDVTAFVDLIEREAEHRTDPAEVPPATEAARQISCDFDLDGLAAEDVTVLTPGALLERLRS